MVNMIKKKIIENDGYCPCRIVKCDDNKCMCKEFRESTQPGLCKCGLFEKIIEKGDEISWRINFIVKMNALKVLGNA